jgi:hypothetical protein
MTRTASAIHQRTALAFTSAVESGRLNVPLPGSGSTWERWAAFADLGEEDLSLARLGEGHADAVAILAELDGPPPVPGSRWGVWAASPPGPNVTASRQGSTWVLHGTKQYCSGARVCTDALVTATDDDEARLFAVAVQDLEPRDDSWPATGMAGSDTLDVGFPGIPAEPVGPPGGYTSRPGFSHGGAGVAACRYGGARGVGRALLRAAAKRDIGPHALAHLGAIDIALHTARAALGQAAGEIDADPSTSRPTAWPWPRRWAQPRSTWPRPTPLQPSGVLAGLGAGEAVGLGAGLDDGRLPSRRTRPAR